MDWTQAVVLGVVQGITEFLPISSSGHLVLLQKLWHIQGDQLLFITLLHIGTLIAVLWAFRADIGWLIRHPLSRFSRMLFVALVPTALIGVLFEDAFDQLFASGATLGLEFVVTGVILWWMDSVTSGTKSQDDVRTSDAVWIGIFQGAAILPALSRSGLTIAGGLWRGLDRDTAGRFSFLVSIPAILGATVLELEKALSAPMGEGATPWGPMMVGTAAAVVAGYLSVRFTLWLLRHAQMRWFALYAWALAAFILADQLFFHHWFPPLVH
ncbi:undecaprenyl-diphosphate phosphatase [Alicyclobacillus cycloheptanicus]|uniref:Undecaprenyl-diphosphatase n=1 Tax=Alicyclobacillus cycloheptanicus TaxID=1457 RepID=A0ABT9XE32_9BACL|nr:undecaprenyl-diphosphate phosphatase [Alicyclobacillus cycloheptanicus]MDQ0188561.1 undecaprenyl-diphosphatase [Alicyclobacillus cycloheptanicus]WDM01244.1 undecaprenyl-diphosphate phosphatase [Alicyclobacillus cycloheptanicus]